MMFKRLLTTLLLSLLTLTVCHGDGAFRARIGEWELAGVRVYDDPDLGFSVRYDQPETQDKFDVYFYNNGQTDLGTGLSGNAVARELGLVIAGIQEMGKRGYYADISEPKLGQGTIDLNGDAVAFMFAHVTYRQTDKDSEKLGNPSTDLRQSFAFLTTYNGRFLKVRFTVISEDYDAAFAQFNGILEQLERSF